MYKRFVCCFVALALILTVAPPIASGTAKTSIISGTVYLPNGEVAPAGGIQVQVLNGLGDSAFVRIQQGQNSATYSFATQPGLKQNVRYLIHRTDYAGSEYIRQGYYAGRTTVLYATQASKITPSQNGQEGIDLYISKGVTISGTIRLPQGYTAPAGGTHVQVGASGVWVNVIIPAGQSSVEYTLTTPPGAYIISFVSFSDERFIRETFYHESRSVFERSSGSTVDVTRGPVTGINVELAVGVRLSGTLSLKDKVAPPGGQQVALSTQSGIYIWFLIPAGQSCANFTWTMPANQGSVYINYKVDDALTGEVASGYYIAKWDTAPTSIKIEDHDITGIDIVVQDVPFFENIVSGRVYLPKGDVAPLGGLRIQVLNEHGEGKYVRIEHGQNSAAYSFHSSSGLQHVRYEIWPEDYKGTEYIRQGYYAGNTTTVSLSKARAITSSPIGQTSVDLYIARGVTVSGTISLPEGYTALGWGTRILVSASECSVNVLIPSGESSVDYVLTVSPGVHKISFAINTPDIDFRLIPEVFYHNSRAVLTQASASWVDVSQGAATGIDIRLLKAVRVNGTLSIRGGVAPAGGVAVLLSTQYGHSNRVVIPEGKSSVQYSWVFPPRQGGIFIIYRIENPASDYVDWGYYNDKGRHNTTWLDIQDTDIRNINIEIGKRPVIKGTMSLPEGMVAPLGGLHIRLRNGFDSDVDVHIPQGESSASYSMLARPDVRNLYYTLPDKPQGLLDSGYYTESGVVADYLQATNFPARPGDIIVLDMVIPQTATIGGTVTLPDGDRPPLEGLKVMILADGVASKEVTIPYWSSNSPFTLQVLAGKEQTLSYQIMQESEYWSKGFYTKEGMVPTKAHCVIAPGANYNVQLELIPKVSIKGIVTLPESVRAQSGGAQVEIKGVGVAESVTIPADGQSALYEIEIPVSTNRLEFETTLAGKEYSGFAALELTKPYRPTTLEPVLLGAKVSLALIIGERGYVLNGRYYDSNPVIYNTNNDTLMPLRMLEVLGARVEWDDTTNTATLRYGDNTVLLIVGTGIAVVNGQPVTLTGASGKPAPVILVGGSTMVPIRFVSESLGFLVEWMPPAGLIITAP